MRLISTEVPTAPHLAYCVTVRGREAHLVHGPGVEIGDDFFTDGAWAGDFAMGRPDSCFIAGTAGYLNGENLRLVAPESPLDRILMSCSGSTLHASNSLPFLLEVLDDSLDPAHLWYRSTVVAAERGVRSAPREMPTTSGRTIRIVMAETAEIGPNGTVQFRPPPVASAINSFHEYRDLLQRTVDAVVANATDRSRRRPLEPLVPLSTGYDSTAVAVLARSAGVVQAVTMRRPDPRDPGHLLDHPGEVAKILGMTLDEVGRNRWRSRTDLPEAELAATATSMMDVVMLTLEDRLPGRLLMLGVSGDNMWDAHNYRTAPDFVQGFGLLSGRSLAEHRLRVGYTIFTPPSIAHSAHPSIYRLSNSAEMGPWRVGGSYDRPIARRLIEESGIPRGTFAAKKFGGSGRVGNSRSSAYPLSSRAAMAADLSEVMSHAAAGSFLDFCDAADVRARRRRLRIANIGNLIYNKLENLNHRVGRRFHRFGVKQLVPEQLMALLAVRFRLPLDYTYLLPHWGTSVLRPRYAPAAETVRRASTPNRPKR